MRRLFIFALLVACASQPVTARFLVGGRSFEEMLREADLVVVATAMETRETAERSKLIDIDKLDTSAPKLLQEEVIGVETHFVVRVALKSSEPINKFVLHHYKLHAPEEMENGPQLLEIPERRHATFLMFLRKEKDGRFAPFTGQFDPAVLSIFEIRESSPGRPAESHARIDTDMLSASDEGLS